MRVGNTLLPVGSIRSAQQAQGKWQRPLQPYMGSPQGILLAGIIGGTDANNAMAYVRTGDICLHYGLDANYDVWEKGAPQYLPPTRVRCASQQWHWFTDKVNIPVCLGFEPARLGQWMMEKIFTPIFKLLPGGMSQFIGPAIAGVIGQAMMGKLDTMLANLPFRFGMIYQAMAYVFRTWIFQLSTW